MKKCILIPLMIWGSFSFAQNSKTSSKHINTEVTAPPKNYQDSLNLAIKMINELDYSNLIKQKERFTYLSREKSGKIYPAVLLIITDRVKNYYNEK